LPFVDSGATFAPVFRSAVAWGDYDRDGDLDLILTWLAQDSQDVSKLYRNDGGGVFTDVGAPFAPMESGSADWIDYDRDGDLDLFLSGTFAERRPALYRNDGALGLHQAPTSSSIPKIVPELLRTWGDVDTTRRPGPGARRHALVGRRRRRDLSQRRARSVHARSACGARLPARLARPRRLRRRRRSSTA
jgi:hypothetical protein